MSFRGSQIGGVFGAMECSAVGVCWKHVGHLIMDGFVQLTPRVGMTGDSGFQISAFEGFSQGGS